jgi:hypothetical protein
MAKKQTCDRCYFFVSQGGQTNGQCHRFPPKPVLVPKASITGDTQLAIGTYYPITSVGAWCGEWKAKLSVPESVDEEGNIKTSDNNE